MLSGVVRDGVVMMCEGVGSLFFCFVGGGKWLGVRVLMWEVW